MIPDPDMIPDPTPKKRQAVREQNALNKAKVLNQRMKLFIYDLERNPNFKKTFKDAIRRKLLEDIEP